MILGVAPSVKCILLEVDLSIMLHAHDKVRRSNSTQSITDRLAEIYRALSDYLQAVELVPTYSGNPYLRALAIIIEEDLASLVGECEAMLGAADEIDRQRFDSFVSLAVTVIEEAEYLLNRDDLKISMQKPQGAQRRHRVRS